MRMKIMAILNERGGTGEPQCTGADKVFGVQRNSNPVNACPQMKVTPMRLPLRRSRQSFLKTYQ